MKRNAVNKLIEWNESGTKVPFLLMGTKGTGKTYLAMEFANSYFPQCLYVNFELNTVARQYFNAKITAGDSVAEALASYFQIDEFYLTELIVILDEISYCPKMLEALKEHNEVSILAISGVCLPIETTNHFICCRLYPLAFDEFLSAVGSDWYIDIIQGHFQNQKPVPDIVHQELLALFEEYLIVGGMPAAVNEYISSKSVYNVGEVHAMVKNRMRAVLEDTYDDKTAGKAVQILNVLSEQLSKENKKFRFNLIRKGVTYSLYKDSIDILENNGMVLRLNEQKKNSHFKLYLPDVGMLSSMFLGNETIEIRKAILENFVMQSLCSNENFKLSFWESEAMAKVEFLLERSNETTPVELRTSTNAKGKSIASYMNSCDQNCKKYFRLGFENFYSTPVMTQIPYYAVFCIK